MSTRGRIKSDEMYCYEFLAKYSYSSGYLQSKLYDDPNIKSFVERLTTAGYPNLARLNGGPIQNYSNPILLEISKDAKEWADIRRMDKSKNKGRKSGVPNKNSIKFMLLQQSENNSKIFELIENLTNIVNSNQEQNMNAIKSLENEVSNLNNKYDNKINEIKEMNEQIFELRIDISNEFLEQSNKLDVISNIQKSSIDETKELLLSVGPKLNSEMNLLNHE